MSTRHETPFQAMERSIHIDWGPGDGCGRFPARSPGERTLSDHSDSAGQAGSIAMVEHLYGRQHQHPLVFLKQDVVPQHQAFTWEACRATSAIATAS